MATNFDGLLDFPSTIPTTEILQLVLDSFKGRNVDKRLAGRAAYHVVGYVAGQVLPEGPIKVGGVNADVDVGLEAAEAAFVTAMNDVSGVRATASAGGETNAVPWGIVAQVAWQVFQAWLNRRK